MHNSRGPIAIGVVGLLLASSLLVACGQKSDDVQDPKESVLGLSAEEVAARYSYVDRGEGVTPVYVLVPEFSDPSDVYARELLARQCLAGVVEYNPVPPEQKEIPWLDSRTGLPKFDEQLAAQFGYGWLHSAGSADPVIPFSVTITESMMEQMEACGQEADARLGDAPETLLNDIAAAGGAALEADTRGTIRKAAQAWQACMEPVGVIDLPEDPAFMPPESIVANTTVVDESGVMTEGPQTEVTQRERDVAVADARCRVESGYVNAERQVRVDAELEAIGRNIEGFEAVRAQYVEYQKGIDAVIAELG
jgi:hypothetical protein